MNHHLAGMYVLGYKQVGAPVPFYREEIRQQLAKVLSETSGTGFVLGTDCCIASLETGEYRCAAGRTVQAFDPDGTPHPCSFSDLIQGECPYLAGIPVPDPKKEDIIKVGSSCSNLD